MSDPSGAVPRAALRPLGLAEILDGAVRAVRRNPRAALSIGAPFAVVGAAASAAYQLGISGSSDATLLTVVGSLLTTVALGTLLAGILAPLFTEQLLGRRLDALPALALMRGHWLALVLLAVVVTLAEGAGLVLLVAGGVWLWGRWAVAAPALTVERTTALGALRRSAELVRGDFWRAWGIRAAGWVLTTVLGFFVVVPFEALAAYLSGTNLLDPTAGIQHPGLYVTITAAGNLVSALILGPVGAAVQALLYVDLRMRREGMDLLLELPPDPLAGERPAVTAW